MIQIISPHIDDAMLSLGGSIFKWKNQNKKVKIIYVFTKSCWTNKYNIAGKEYPNNIKKITNIRRAEEEKIQDILKTDVEFLGNVEKSLRSKYWPEKKNPTWKDFLKNLSKKYIKVNEQEMIDKIKKTLYEKIDKNSICFFPLAVYGWNHPDHVILREIGLEFLNKGYKIYFYEELPYIANDNNKTDVSLENIKLKSIFEEINMNKKLGFLVNYQSQMSQEWLNQVKAYGFSLKENRSYERYWKPR